MIGWTLSRALLNLVGFAYPAYSSFKALRSPSVEDDQQWLTYWVVYGFFSVFEYWLDLFISWFPFYYEIKLLFVVWLQFPGVNGAKFIYDTVIAPQLAAKEQDIDKALAELFQVILNKIKQLPALVYQLSQKGVSEVVRTQILPKLDATLVTAANTSVTSSAPAAVESATTSASQTPTEADDLYSDSDAINKDD